MPNLEATLQQPRLPAELLSKIVGHSAAAVATEKKTSYFWSQEKARLSLLSAEKGGETHLGNLRASSRFLRDEVDKYYPEWKERATSVAAVRYINAPLTTLAPDPLLAALLRETKTLHLCGRYRTQAGKTIEEAMLYMTVGPGQRLQGRCRRALRAAACLQQAGKLERLVVDGLVRGTLLTGFVLRFAAAELRYLALVSVQVGCVEACRLHRFANLVHLDLTGNLLNEFFQPMQAAALPRTLRTLNLNGTHIGDWGAEDLFAQPLKALQRLALDTTNVSEDALDALALQDRSSLVELSCRANKVTARSLVRLRHVSLPRLTMFDVAQDNYAPNFFGPQQRRYSSWPLPSPERARQLAVFV